MTIVLLDLPLWVAESSAILAGRNACGDEATLSLGRRFLGEDAQQTLAERHPNQVSSMIETKTGEGGD